MSGVNGGALPDITLDELERLIKILGLLGSAHDGEVVAAARAARKWLADKRTDWEALLVPAPEPLPVVGVSASPDLDALEEAHEADRAQAFKNGYAAGMRDMGAQLRAQAAAMAPGPPGGTWTTMAQNAPGGGLGGFSTGPGSSGTAPAQGPVRSPGGPQQAYPAGTWQWAVQQLLARDAQGIPGVFRGSREADFVGSLLARGWKTLTGPQEQWLRDIAGRSGLSW